MVNYPMMPHERDELFRAEVAAAKAELTKERETLKSSSTRRAIVELSISNPHPGYDPVDVAERAYKFFTEGLSD